VSSLSARSPQTVRQTTWWTLAVAGLITAALTLPLAPVNSAWWRVADTANGNFNDEIGYRELVETVVKIRDALPAQQSARLGILAGDVGEAGAVNLCGPACGLPRAISGMNSYWLRGYGDPPPETVIVAGKDRNFVNENFASCDLVGHLTNQYEIVNNAIDGYADVLLCRHLRQPWPNFWKYFQHYG